MHLPVLLCPSFRHTLPQPAAGHPPQGGGWRPLLLGTWQRWPHSWLPSRDPWGSACGGHGGGSPSPWTHGGRRGMSRLSSCTCPGETCANERNRVRGAGVGRDLCGPRPRGSPGAHGHLVGVVDVGTVLAVVAPAEAVVVHAVFLLLLPPPLPRLPDDGQAALHGPAVDRAEVREPGGPLHPHPVSPEPNPEGRTWPGSGCSCWQGPTGLWGKRLGHVRPAGSWLSCSPPTYWAQLPPGPRSRLRHCCPPGKTACPPGRGQGLGLRDLSGVQKFHLASQ